MNIVTIKDHNSGSTARIAVDRGFNCFQFIARLADGREVDVLAATDDFAEGKQPETHHGNPLLFPYPNRIEGGRYLWNGTEYQIPADRVLYDSTGNAIHGLCLDRPWRVIQQSNDKVTGTFRLSIDAADRLDCWPTDAEIHVSYQVIGSCLRSEIRVFNSGNQSMPWGFGTHAYFRVPLSANSSADQCQITVPGSKVWKLTECLPSGEKTVPPEHARLNEGRIFKGLKVDDIYTDVVTENNIVTCRITDPAAGVKVEQRCPSSFRELVVFTPPWSSSVCMEPYTCVTNAINLEQRGVDAGLQVLQPGETWTGWIDIEAIRL
jgi:aldose 1-epimerase